MTTELLRRVDDAERRRRWRMLLGPATDDVAERGEGPAGSGR